MKTLLKITLAFIIAIALTSITTKSGNAQFFCDPGTPHIEILNHPDATAPHLEGKYIYQNPYRVEFADNHCGLNIIRPVDPCNPWVLEFYVAYFEDENDKVLVKDAFINWDTALCQDFRTEYIYPPNYIPNTYYDSVVVKYKVIPHASDGCIPDGNIISCFGGSTINNLNCWVSCLHEKIKLECIDSCEVPNVAMCNVEYDKPLPVELSSFTSAVDNGNVILTWETSAELNNSGFDVERRTDGIWSKVGFVKGINASSDYTFVDKNLKAGSYGYRLKQIDFNGNFEYFNLLNNVSVGIPDKFYISQNYPNPFNPNTKIDFALPYSANVSMKVYDMRGREVATIVNEFKTAGYYSVDFNASNIASGIYYYKITTGTNTAVHKMVVIK